MVKVTNFVKDQSGNFAIIAGLSMFPMLFGAGIAVDYSRMLNDQKTVQQELDVALLAASHDLTKKSDEQVKQLIISQLTASLNPTLAASLENINIVLDKNNGSINAFVAGSTEPSITAIAGYEKLGFETTSSIRLNLSKVEVALVLDNTGSMNSSGKLAALKTSSKDFVNSLFDEAAAGKVKVGLVPFSKYVNVGVSNKNESWIDVEPDNGQNVFHGCVGSRKQPFNLNDKKYTGNKKIPGLLQVTSNECPNALQTLTDNRSDLISQLDDMQAQGWTYIPSGVMWGWRVLSNDAPFKQGAKSTDTQTQKIMVLMTDGDNTVAPSLPQSPLHNSWDANLADKWTETSCKNAKAEGISIYTITFGTSIKNKTKKLMVNCASSPDNYYDATNASALNDAFDSILNKLTNLHLSS